VPRLAIGAALSVFTLVLGGGATAAPDTSVRTSYEGKLAYIGKIPALHRPALYLVNSDGSGRELLSRSGVIDHTTFSWSPDGTKIAFTGGPSRQPQIFVVNADGSGLRRLTSGLEWPENPSWSPDGRFIAVDALGARDAEQIFVMRADGTGRRMLTRSTARNLVPSWSPNGRLILFERSVGVGEKWAPDGRVDLYAIGSNGRGKRKVARLRTEPEHCVCAAWSPDGTKIVYEAAKPGGKPDIYVMNVDGTGRTRLTRHPARDENPDWSPDGKEIAFYSERPGNAQIYVMRADGTTQRRITHDPWYDQAVRWQPAPRR
jgi:Tol biopolymer transport system component